LTPNISQQPCILNESMKWFYIYYCTLLTQTSLSSFKIKKNSNKETWEMTQSVSIVYNSELFGRQENAESSIWTFKTIFGQSLNGVCPVAHLSNIYFDFGSNGVANNFCIIFSYSNHKLKTIKIWIRFQTWNQQLFWRIETGTFGITTCERY
jgi:hypothetical protein